MNCTNLLPAFLALGWILGSCSQEAPSQNGTASRSNATAAAETDPSKGPLRWSTPEGWTEVPPANDKRERQYAIPMEGGAPLEVVVSLWPGHLGGVDANVARWRSSLGIQDGDEEPLVETLSHHGMLVTLFDGKGNYTAMGGEQIGEARLLTAFLESPSGRFDGVYTLRLVGPASQVEPQTEVFRNLVLGL